MNKNIILIQQTGVYQLCSKTPDGTSVVVYIKMDFEMKTYKIQNEHGNDNFKFVSGSNVNIEIWNVVVKLIESAIEYAEDLLRLNKKK